MRVGKEVGCRGGGDGGLGLCQKRAKGKSGGRDRSRGPGEWGNRRHAFALARGHLQYTRGGGGGGGWSSAMAMKKRWKKKTEG